MPRVGTRPRLYAWLGYVVVVTVVALVLFATLVNARVFERGVPAEYALVVAGLLVLTMPSFLRRFSQRAVTGIVTQLRQDFGTSKRKTSLGWGLDLQPCDKSWKPLTDKGGFTAARIEVSFDVSNVHGEPLEEGSRVAVVGRKKQHAILAHKIWNLNPASMATGGAQTNRVFGRVTDLQPPDHVRDTRYADGRTLQVRNFRIQPTDPRLLDSERDETGNLVPAVPVEIRAGEITGLLQEGDKVEVIGYRVAGNLHSKEVYNHSAGGAPLVVKGWVPPA